MRVITGTAMIDFIDGIFQLQKESVVNIFLFVILRIELSFGDVFMVESKL